MRGLFGHCIDNMATGRYDRLVDAIGRDQWAISTETCAKYVHMSRMTGAGIA